MPVSWPQFEQVTPAGNLDLRRLLLNSQIQINPIIMPVRPPVILIGDAEDARLAIPNIIIIMPIK